MQLTLYLRQRAAQLGVKAAKANAITLQRIVSHEQQQVGDEPMPECFGLRFCAPDDPDCSDCEVQGLCLHRSAHKTLLDALPSMPSTSHSDVAQALSMPPNIAAMLCEVAVRSGCLPRAKRNAVVVPPPHHAADTNVRRRERERARVPGLAELPEGTVLRRRYDGQERRVRVVAGGYKFEQTTYPTLYAATMAITGVRAFARRDAEAKVPHRYMSSYSAGRFWKAAIAKALSARSRKPRRPPPPMPQPPPAATAPGSDTTATAAAEPAAPHPAPTSMTSALP